MSREIEVEFFFDIASPYSYMAATRIDALEEQTAAEVQWRPFLLGGVLKSTGNSPPAQVPAKAKYMLADLNRWAERYEVPFEMPGNFPLNTISTQRALVAADRQEGAAMVPLAEEVYRAYWAQGRDVSDASVIEEIADDIGMDGGAIVEAIDTPAVKEKLEENSDEAVERGAFGAPSFFIGDELFWGNDRLSFVREEVRRRAD